jgi:hypothetical protein
MTLSSRRSLSARCGSGCSSRDTTTDEKQDHELDLNLLMPEVGVSEPAAPAIG